MTTVAPTQLKLTPAVTAILKNFAVINPVFAQWETSNLISTRTKINNVRVQATLEQSVPNTLKLDNLTDFLQVVSLFDTPVIEFETGVQVKVREEGRKTHTSYEMLKESLARETLGPIKFPNPIPTPIVTFDLNAKTLSDVQKAADVIGLDFVVFEITAREVLLRLKTSGKEDGKSRQYENEAGLVTGGEKPDNTYVIGIKLELLRLLLAGDYTVQMSQPAEGKCGHFVFTNKKVKINYFIQQDLTKIS